MIGVKREPLETAARPPRHASGKLIAVVILIFAVIAAGISWGFRFYATHDAAGFWGPDAARLIRDAAGIKLTRINRNADGLITTSITRDVSSAQGITHLRTALLEDNSYRWPATDVPPATPSGWKLVFGDDSADKSARIWFTPDLKQLVHFVGDDKCRTISCEPISGGLQELFTEMMAGPSAESRAPSR